MQAFFSLDYDTRLCLAQFCYAVNLGPMQIRVTYLLTLCGCGILLTMILFRGQNKLRVR